MKINTTFLPTLRAWASLCLLILASSCEKPVDTDKNADGLPSGKQALLTMYNPPIPGAINVLLEGSNLYQANKVELLLRNRKGKQYRIAPVSYESDGQMLKINLPPAIDPSQYHLQWLRDGQPVSSFSRFLVQTVERTQPQFISIRNIDLTGDPTTPLKLNRGTAYFFQYVITKNSKSVQVVLKSISDPTQVHSLMVDQAAVDTYNELGPDFGKPSFTIPTDISPGRYNLFLHYTSDRVLIEGEPFEREIEI